MNFRDFLPLAASLATGTTEAEWRSAVSRAYYAAFHVGCRLLGNCGFAVPRADRAHSYVWLRLANCGNATVRDAGEDLNTLRQERNRADYDSRHSIGSATAAVQVRTAAAIIQGLEAAELDPTRNQITEAMKIYERDVLREVTWHP